MCILSLNNIIIIMFENVHFDVTIYAVTCMIGLVPLQLNDFLILYDLLLNG